MKTSELKKIVEDNGFLFRKTNNLNVYIDDKGGNLFSLQNLETIYVDIQRVVRTKAAKDVMRALLDYSETPLEEREEEKKYRLKSKLIEFESERDLYLINSSLLKKYCLSTNSRQSFTQKEIDDMPFDTNFFIKEEVE